jgi:hypothetical protein
MIEFISTLVTIPHNYNQYSAIADIHAFRFTVAHALGFSVFTSRPLATDLNTESSASNHYEVFLPFLVQSPWNLGTELKTLGLSLAASGLMFYSRGTDNAENTSHVIAKQCWDVTSLHLRRSMFVEPLPGNALTCHNIIYIVRTHFLQ